MRGREAELASLAALSTSLVVVAGPPGVGKSRLLQVNAAKCAQNSAYCAAYEPVDLEYRPGSLQFSLLGSLGLALAAFESSEDLAARWHRVFTGALSHAVDTTTKDLIRGAIFVMNGVVRSRLGDTAGNALKTFEDSLMTAVDEQLGRRISSEADPGAMRAFCVLAEQVQTLVDCPVVLTLDRGERLSDMDIRLLCDLLEILPKGVHVHLGHTRAKHDDESRIAQIKASGSSVTAASAVLELVGLDRPEVVSWMTDLGLEPDQEAGGIDEVVRVTSGYPLHVDLALGTIQRGDSLDQLKGDDALASMIEGNYRTLDAEDQLVLMLLAAFTDPPETVVLLGVLEIDEQLWTVRQKRLIDARFLVSQVEGTPWFHELGRRLLWDSVLSDGQRTTAASRVARVLLSHCESAEDVRITYCIDLARLAQHTPELFKNDPSAQAVLKLGPTHLAVLASLEELTSEDQPTALIGDTVYHARRRFGPVPDDLYDAAEQLRAHELLVISEDEQNQVLVVSWGSQIAKLLGVGRMYSECSRTPIKTIASVVLGSVILPCSGGFHTASLGAGYTSLVNLSKQMEQLEYDRTSIVITMRKRPGVLVLPTLGSLAFAGFVAFDDEASRDQSLEFLTGPKAPLRVFGETWNTENVYCWPQAEPLPARRFTAAAELLTGANFHFGPPIPKISGLIHGPSLGEEMQLVVQTWRTLAGLSDSLTRAVLNLTRPAELPSRMSTGV